MKDDSSDMDELAKLLGKRIPKKDAIKRLNAPMSWLQDEKELLKRFNERHATRKGSTASAPRAKGKPKRHRTEKED